MDAALEALVVIGAMATDGLATSVSDAGVGALMAGAAVRGARLNVAINARGVSDTGVRGEYLARAARIAAAAADEESRILAEIEERMDPGAPG
jgi:glutamate formiminotransferase/formiminotetrahydrofolate cyclodeaminase